MATNKYFTTSIHADGKKIITIDTKHIPIPAEEQAAQMYVNAGYEIRFKSEKRAAAARKRAKESGFGSKKAKAEE